MPAFVAVFEEAALVAGVPRLVVRAPLFVAGAVFLVVGAPLLLVEAAGPFTR